MMIFIFYVKDYQKLCLNHFHIMTTLALKALGFLVLVKHYLIFYADHLKKLKLVGLITCIMFHKIC